jgi:hypothetical protein
MTEEILDAIKEAVRTTVNGKIDNIHRELLLQNKTFDKHIADENKWQSKFDPMLDAMTAGKMIGRIAKWIVIVGTAIGVLYKLFTFK